MKIGLKFNFSDMVHGKEGVKNTFKLFTMHHPLEYSYNKVRKTFEVSFKVNFEYLSVPHRPPQFNTSVQQKHHTFSARKISQFNTKSSPFQQKKTDHPQFNQPQSSTPETRQLNTKTPYFNKPLSSTPKIKRMFV